ncbi:[Fe-Fe] hydrogenase large subunit C-terminal domain-containing protein [Desulfofalx alkaliphila]|uniref:[Fe-Fe] hydrogenase large subunit C-terminal domain-containing protein n=1 Tax=Desulfofalx alkaliphila TaxID=105483 RepID=UPI000689DCF4|nr:[Fe-Fe] hydrogenase large subunit C-terminal domain-containing protein [Desulfofalx alkaliphila]
MQPNEFTHRLMVSLARQIKESGIKDRDKTVNRIMKDCFDDNDPQREFWRQRVEKRLSLMLDDESDDNSLLVQMIEGACDNCAENKPCVEVCPTGAIDKDEQGNYKINAQRCVECTWCVDNCITGSIVHRSEFAQVANMIMQRRQYPVYAILAPAFVGQFGEKVTPEILKGALKSIGFSDVYEVAMAADVVTVQEAKEFVERMDRGEKFMITSCCCPAFIKLVEKIRPKVANLVSASMSPMIALGKMLKEREPHCRVVFIGPCIAKKAEAKRPDLQPAVDCVLTFKETRALLEAADVPLDGSLGEIKMEDASHDGRIYAHTAGVTEAITRAVETLAPHFEIRAVYGDGLKECNKLLKELEEGKLNANFMEGMGCPHGCVGGPGTILNSKEAAKLVRAHANQARAYEALANDKARRWNDFYGMHADLLSEKEDIIAHV